MGLIKLRLSDWDDPHTLFVHAAKGDFSGSGSAYVSLHDYEKFVRDLTSYPLDRASLRLTHSGHVAITAYPHDRVGHLAIEVELVENEGESANFVRICLMANYPQTARFGTQLSMMRDRELSEVTLEEIP